MSAIVGERDNLIMNTVPRFAAAVDRVLLLAVSSSLFRVPTAGLTTPSSVTFTAGLINMSGAVAFSASNASVLSQSGNTVVLAAAGMVGNTVTVTATITVDGITYTATQTVSKVFDGYDGKPGAPGDPGSPGVKGNSARVCYSKTSLTSLSNSPTSISTEGDNSYPPPNMWGQGTVWEGSPQILAAGENLYRSDGTYNPNTGVTSWAAPYMNSFKVFALDAFTANLGRMTSGDITGTVLHGGPGYAHSTYTWPQNLQGGYHLSADGLLLGNPLTGRYFQLTGSGDVYAPGLSIVNGSAIFSGNLAAATGTFAGELQAATGTIGLLRSKAAGQRTEFDSNGVRAYGPNSGNPMGGLVARMGVW
ncbi:hypothetical protein ASF61_06885 [Duganella sp. Leaf126]|uniref:hypothetical protein n=1 Tax=Duganella sp. Leaf126 TaxID=1736266 RepID=UPI0006F95BF5|nr:hypothetical protein [Duganella sp. Leaf126]KQQ40472.1 hypothetical protein ASF61_06885 [Duganella sp. Leaf126]